MDKKAKIIELLLEYPNGLKAREISKKLPYIDKKEVNQILYGNSNDFVAIDYVWKLTNIKAKSSSQEKEYKKAEIDNLFHNYNTPYFDTKKLVDLDLATFKIAVEHAKEVAEHNLSYDLGKMWYKIVIMPDKLFREVIDKHIEQKRIETEMRVAKIKRERQEKVQREEAIKRICRKNNLSENVANSLISLEISVQEVENRIRNVRYYEAKYPEFNIALSNGIMMTTQDFNKYIYGKLEKPRAVCLGDCSTCRRDICLMDKQ